MSQKFLKPRVGIVTTSNEPCYVCGDSSAGWHCGTITCEACKKFFLRKHKEGVLSISNCVRNTNNCIITKTTRTNCQYCRFQRCVQVGMKIPEEEREQKPQVADFSGIPCMVCQDQASGLHFGAITCEGCKGFFRRNMNERERIKLKCENGDNCQINHSNRNSCRACRFHKCIQAGMSLNGIKIGRQSNLFKKKLREVAGDPARLESTVSLTIKKTNNPKHTAPMSEQIDLDDIEPYCAELIRNLLQAEQTSRETRLIFQSEQNPTIPFEFMANHFERCKRFLESFKLYQELDEINRKMLLLNSIHPIQALQVLTQSTSAEPNYFDFDEERMQAIAMHFPSFEAIRPRLANLSPHIRALKLDNEEIIIYKAYLVFCSLDFKYDWRSIHNIQNDLFKTLRQFMSKRRSENESSQLLFQMSVVFQTINLELQKGLKNDCQQLKSKGYINYDILSQYFAVI